VERACAQLRGLVDPQGCRPVIATISTAQGLLCDEPCRARKVHLLGPCQQPLCPVDASWEPFSACGCCPGHILQALEAAKAHREQQKQQKQQQGRSGKQQRQQHQEQQQQGPEGGGGGATGAAAIAGAASSSAGPSAGASAAERSGAGEVPPEPLTGPAPAAPAAASGGASVSARADSGAGPSDPERVARLKEEDARRAHEDKMRRNPHYAAQAGGTCGCMCPCAGQAY